MDNIKELRAKIQALKNKAKGEGRDLTAEEVKEVNGYMDDIESRLAVIEAEKRAAALEARLSEPEPRAVPDVGDTAEPAVADQDKPVYRSIGEQLRDVASFAKGEADERAINRLNAVYRASGLNTGISSEGGALVQTDFTTQLLKLATEQAVLAPKCSKVGIGPNSDSLEAPYLDETSRVTGSRWGGVRVYRRAEAATVAASKPALGKWELRLEDLMAFCYATGRSLQDASALTGIIKAAFPSEMAFTLDDEIFRGTGVGQCQGIIGADCAVSVAKETGQAADTIVAENIIKMFARMPARLMGGAEWYINQACLPQLMTMSIAVGTGGQLVYMPPNGLVGGPYGTLLGRPVNMIEQASALGDLGDIVFANFREYMLIDKDGIQAAQSMHVKFLYDEECFRFIYRVNGQPKWKSSLTPYKGTNALSPFVTLAAR